MKTRNLLIVVILAVAVAGGIWYATMSAPAEPAKVAEAPKPAPTAPKPAAPAPVVVAPKIEAPKAPPAVVQAPAVAVVAKPAPSGSTQDAVMAELNSTITEMVSTLQTGDFMAFMDRFMPPDQASQIPPEMRAQMAQQLAQNPQMQQQMQMMSEALQSLQGQTPTINDAGDHATYQMTPPAGMAPPGANIPATIPVTFVKIDGKWYADKGM